MVETQADPSFGILFHPTFPSESLGEYACRAEAVGFDELWLWDDCFLPGALTSAAIALAATRTLRVGIGLMPATAYNPLFAAMEITTLARAFPGRIFPGFGHGVPVWMTQIGAAPKSSLKTLGETVNVVRRLLAGECVSVDANDVHLDAVQMQVTPTEIPPLYVGAMREKSLQLAGRVGDGTVLTAMSSPEYVRWARAHIQRGMAESQRLCSSTLWASRATRQICSRSTAQRILPRTFPTNGWTRLRRQGTRNTSRTRSRGGMTRARTLSFSNR